MLTNPDDILSCVGMVFSFLEVSPKLRSNVIEYLKACDTGEHDESQSIPRLARQTRAIFYTSDIEKGYYLVIDGIKQAIGLQEPEGGVAE